MSDGFVTVLGAIANALFLIGSLYVYLSLIRQINARATLAGEDAEQTFGLPDAFAATGLAALFAMNALLASSHTGKMTMSARDLIANGLVSAAMLLFVAAFLKLRGLRVTLLAGFTRLGFSRTLLSGCVLLFAAYPLIFVADILSQRVLGGTPSRQGIVELFDESQTLEQRVLIIILAVVIAPMVEEFVFRFYLYGVIKRYAGRFAGLIINALLFAAVHGHAPSAAPLFVLGACFTLAYEWSGSILVCMTMHALFNSLTLTALAFPDVFPQ